MLAHRLRRWPDIDSALRQRLVFAIIKYSSRQNLGIRQSTFYMQSRILCCRVHFFTAKNVTFLCCYFSVLYVNISMWCFNDRRPALRSGEGRCPWYVSSRHSVSSVVLTLLLPGWSQDLFFLSIFSCLVVAVSGSMWIQFSIISWKMIQVKIVSITILYTCRQLGNKGSYNIMSLYKVVGSSKHKIYILCPTLQKYYTNIFV